VCVGVRAGVQDGRKKNIVRAIKKHITEKPDHFRLSNYCYELGFSASV